MKHVNDTSLEHLKNALNEKLKDTELKNRLLHIVELKVNSEKTGLLAKIKVVFTKILIKGTSEHGPFRFQTDEHFYMDVLFEESNLPVRKTSPFTLRIQFKGEFNILNISKEQFFNIEIIETNPDFSNLSEQSQIEYAFKLHPKLSIKNNQHLLNIKPFTLNMIDG